MSDRLAVLRSLQMPLSLSEDLTRLEAARVVTASTPRVVTYASDPPEGGDTRPLALPGTLVIYIAKSDDVALEQIRAAAVANQLMPESVVTRLDGEIPNLNPISLNNAAQLLSDSESFIRVSYRGTALISHFALRAGLTLAPFSFVYSGYPLKPEEFSIISFSKDGVEQKLDAVIVLCAPLMTEAERVAVALVPDDARSLHVASVVPEANVAAAVIVAAAMIAVAVTYALLCGRGLGVQHPHVEDPPQFPNDLSERTPRETLTTIMERRRDALARGL